MRPALPFRSRLLRLAGAAAALACLLPVAADAQFGRRPSPEAQQRQAAERGYHSQFALPPREALRQTTLLSDTLSAVQPQRPGTVDAYVLSVGMDSDPVFGREAAEAGRVLARRYGAEGRAITLANGTGAGERVPSASPTAFAAALARIGQVMDPAEDVLVLYVTTHGHWVTGLAWKDGQRGLGNIGPVMLASMLEDAGIRNRLLIISACFSGVFVPALESPTTLVLTAASADRTSFGCAAENDWTFFGDALINRELRKPMAIEAAFTAARNEIRSWETELRVPESNPQSSRGAQVDHWLAVLEARRPATASDPVGRPAHTPAAPVAARPGGS